MDLRWLTAEEHELEAAIAALDEESRPEVEGRSLVPAGIGYILLLVYFGLIWLGFSNSIDAAARPRVPPSAVGGLVINLAVFVALWYATTKLAKWLDRPRRESEVRAWREHLTGMVNDVDIEPVNRATFVSLITGERRTASCRPRFSAPGVEFGNLTSRTHSALEWHYLATQLPAPLPHLILRSTAAGPLPRELAGAEIGEIVPTGYPFNRSFVLHAPAGYAQDALYVLTPRVMALLLDHAGAFHIEIIGDTLVFFAPGHADFGTTEPWQAIDALWTKAVPAIVGRAARYRDERVPDQSFRRRLLTYRESQRRPGHTWERSRRRIAPAGKRLAQQRRGPRWSMARKHGLEFVVYWLVMGAAGLVCLGLVLTVVKLYEAFFGG